VSRILHHHAPPARLAATGALAATAFIALAVTACGSSSSTPATTAVLGSQVQQDCTAVADVLSNGPDPDADPAGYAQAQILPLRQLKLSDSALQRDVLALAAAYQAVSTGGGTGSAAASTAAAAAAAVTKAENSVNSICPQAAP
jgi:hypothetical protein